MRSGGCLEREGGTGRGERGAPIILLLPVSVPDLAYRLGPLFAVISLDDCLRVLPPFSFAFFGESDSGDHFVDASE